MSLHSIRSLAGGERRGVSFGSPASSTNAFHRALVRRAPSKLERSRSVIEGRALEAGQLKDRRSIPVRDYTPSLRNKFDIATNQNVSATELGKSKVRQNPRQRYTSAPSVFLSRTDSFFGKRYLSSVKSSHILLFPSFSTATIISSLLPGNISKQWSSPLTLGEHKRQPPLRFQRQPTGGTT